MNKEKPITTRFPGKDVRALSNAIKMELAINESDYIRNAVRKTLREDGCYTSKKIKSPSVKGK